MRKHLVWFPFLLVALTVILALTIVFVDRDRVELAETLNTYQQAEESVQTIGLDPSLYRDAAREALLPVWGAVDSGTGDVNVVKGVRDSVLELRVSQEDRDTHILLVAALNTLITGIQGDETALADAQIRFEELTQTTLWLRTEN
ncbi:hypothetical protein HOI83_04165 [Candidatus Uhrbacteria bacterium]|jgi:hypothetical protein|nr:hypothetical protein [Candidatus Uhrbacteria bacterium]